MNVLTAICFAPGYATSVIARRTARLAANVCNIALATMICAAASAALAQYPTKPIRVVVPYSAGSSTDILARSVGEPLSKVLGQPIIVDNRPGANSTIGTEVVARSQNDGYTLLLGTNAGFAASPAGLWRNLNYDPVKDFSPIILVASIYHMLIVHPSLPANSPKQLVALLKANPGKYNYASGNTASLVYGAMLKSITGADILHVPYKSAPPAIIDLVGGRVHIMFTDPATGTPRVRAGQVRALAAAERRSVLLPDLPTMAEAGIEGFGDASGWFAFYAPAGTPRPIVERLNREIGAILKNPETRQWLTTSGYNVAGSTPEELDAYTRAQIQSWTKIIRDYKLEPAG